MLDNIKKYYPLILIAPLVVIRLLIINSSSLTFFSDDAIYASFSRAWTEHDFTHVFHPFWPPLYPFVSSLFFQIIKDWEMTLRIVSLIASVTLLVPVYFLGKHFTSKLAATLACISIFLLEPIVHYSIFPLSDMLAATLIISLLVTFYFALIKKETKLFITAATLLGLLYLTRSEGTMFFGLTFLYVILYVITAKLPKKIIPLFLITFLIVIIPYVISTHNQLGFWTLSQKFNAQIQQGQAFKLKGGSTWAQEIWSIKDPNFNSKYWQNGPDFVLNNFYKFQKSFAEKAEKWKAVLFTNFGLGFVLFSTIGLFWINKKTVWSDLFIIYIVLLAVPITIFSTSVIDTRYLLWTFPILVLCFYKAIFKLAYKFQRFRTLAPLLLIMGTPIFSWSSLDIDSYPKDFTKEHSRPQLVEVAKFISENSQSKELKIMTRHEVIEFYSRGKTVYIPQSSYLEFIDYAKKNNVDYIVAWNRELLQENELTSLVDPNKQHEELHLELTLSTPEGDIVVYSITPPLLLPRK